MLIIILKLYLIITYFPSLNAIRMRHDSSRNINSLSLRDVEVDVQIYCSNSILWIGILIASCEMGLSWVLQNPINDKSTLILAITWASAYPCLCCQMASVDHNDRYFICRRSVDIGFCKCYWRLVVIYKKCWTSYLLCLCQDARLVLLFHYEWRTNILLLWMLFHLKVIDSVTYLQCLWIVWKCLNP